MSDQHHAGIMGCAGDRVAHTPNLDRLAEEGTRFRNAYCTYPLCAPSRMSFMTARHPHELGLFDNEGHLGSDIPTFAHAFLSAGYDTVLSGRMHFVGPDQRHGYRDRIVGEVSGSAYLGAGWRLESILGDLADTPGMGLAGVIKSGPGRTGYHAYDEAVTRATVFAGSASAAAATTTGHDGAGVAGVRGATPRTRRPARVRMRSMTCTR